MWNTPELQAIINARNTCLIAVDQCSYGQPWRKRTRLLFGNCDEQDVLALQAAHRCNGRKKCDYSGVPHVQLTGSDPQTGKPMTARAQTFPKRMNKDLARVLLSEHFSQRSVRPR